MDVKMMKTLAARWHLVTIMKSNGPSLNGDSSLVTPHGDSQGAFKMTPRNTPLGHLLESPLRSLVLLR